MKKIRWGVISSAKIGTEKVIPAMQQSETGEIMALASRNEETSKRVCENLGIPKAYSSYEELLADSEIDAIYNPLPNHLHVPWTIKAAKSGKHVLCENRLLLMRMKLLNFWKFKKIPGSSSLKPLWSEIIRNGTGSKSR